MSDFAGRAEAEENRYVFDVLSALTGRLRRRAIRWRVKRKSAASLGLAALDVVLPSIVASGTCHARRHWNSTSYRAAAGNIPFGEKHAAQLARLRSNGAEGSRTPDLCSAIAALSQLSYSPSYPGVRRLLSPVAPGC